MALTETQFRKAGAALRNCPKLFKTHGADQLSALLGCVRFPQMKLLSFDAEATAAVSYAQMFAKDELNFLLD